MYLSTYNVIKPLRICLRFHECIKPSFQLKFYITNWHFVTYSLCEVQIYHILSHTRSKRFKMSKKTRITFPVKRCAALVLTLAWNPTTCRPNDTYNNSLAQFPRPLKTSATTTSINNTWLIKNRKSLLLSHNIDLILIYVVLHKKKYQQHALSKKYYRLIYAFTFIGHVVR